MFSRSINKQHFIIYAILAVFWAAFQLFSANAYELGWGFIPFVISLPFVPFILVWLGVQFARHYRYIKLGPDIVEHFTHCACISVLFFLFIYHFVY
ncbi:hypothetical protein K0I73_10590 [Shewanella mesophila]|uniref:hypothetical protein n=1 Tax=Shewanella mesophila TaxID=2864208 RepID=UPI001C6557B4|nr:hypothetical protein [Shewanella mesophila]QYJ84716.1 hypothetical protein K0I73_10590 [Shewanella mesophila]